MFPSACAALILGFHALSVASIPTISAVGSKFFYEDGRQYFLKGIAYQRTPKDPLIDPAQCQRDVTRMAELGANAIRVYHVDPAANHDGCMKAFADAGIYLFVDLDTFDTSIRQDSPSWTPEQSNAFKKVLDAFHQYDNTAGFLIGNEVLSTEAGSPAAPYVLAAARDMKSYRNEKGYRQIPIGYTAADIAELRPMLQNYLACRPDPAERLDFFGLNAYEWCGPSSYETSGYRILQDQADGYPIPIFFSETGCNAAPPRTFDDQAAIFGPEMSSTWSGAIIYEWIQEANDYGLINYGPHNPGAPADGTLVQDGYTRQGVPTPVAPDFDNLKSQWKTVSPSSVALTDYVKSTATIQPAACPASTAGGWAVDPSAPLPTLGQTFHPAAPEATAIHVSSGPDADTGVDADHGPNDNSHAGMASAPMGTASSGADPAASTASSSSVAHASTSFGRTLPVPGMDRLEGAVMCLCVLSGALALWL
ncbi:Glucanosyltransferase-domain-containing protein [Aspergillus ambiguus]|uniref:putative 1,3-beta-glucanosyltransferase n=1 Tax=Aspergillus ambiguus TaxID=176160 RepID=UPI003CCD4D16